jgi:hypothetical protein
VASGASIDSQDMGYRLHASHRTRQIEQMNRYIGKAVIAFIHASVVSLLFAAPSGGFGAEPEGPKVFIEEQNLPLTELLDKIARRTGYRIELVGQWPNKKVTTCLQDIPLDVALRKILRELRSVNHVLVFDADHKKVKIVKLDPAKDDAVVGEYASMTEADAQSEPPGRKPASLEDIKAEYRQSQLNRSADMEITPPSDYGPGLTIAEFKIIRREFELKREAQDQNTVISQSSEYGSGMTQAQLEGIKLEHQKQLAAAGPDTVISQSSGYGSGLTRGELELIKQAHAAKTVSKDTTITPPSKYGQPLTVGELEDIKTRYGRTSRDRQTRHTEHKGGP